MRNQIWVFSFGLILSCFSQAHAEEALPSALNPESTSPQLKISKDEMAAIELLQDAGPHGISHPGKCSRTEFNAGCFQQRAERQPDQKGRARDCFCP